jgi:hypothetical protein
VSVTKDGAIAWTEISMPETNSHERRSTSRPNLLATTSFDWSIKRTITAVVSDNTRAVALGEKGATYKVKHPQLLHSQAH